MPSSAADVVKRYFAALDAHDLDAAVACWKPGGVDRFVGQQEVLAREGIREYFGALYAGFPDFSIEVLETVTSRRRAAVRWRGRGTFAGPATYQGFSPNGARIEIEGCDVFAVADDLIEPHPAFNIDTEQARASIRKLRDLGPSVAWAGHADPVRGNVGAQLEAAAATPV